MHAVLLLLRCCVASSRLPITSLLVLCRCALFSSFRARRKEFRDNRSLSGEALQKALWLGEMELKRLQTWVPTGKQMASGEDMHLKL